MIDVQALRAAAATLRPRPGDIADGQAIYRMMLADLIDAEADRHPPTTPPGDT